MSPALAAPLNRPPDLLTGTGGVAEQLGTAKGLPEIIALIINILLSLLGAVFLVLMVYAGFLWMTAQGEKEPVEKATKVIKQAIIGLIITLTAYAISNFVVENLVNKMG